MRVSVSADLEKMAQGLEKRRGLAMRAIAQGLNEGGDKVRTQVQRSLKTQTGLVLYSSVASRVTTKGAASGPPSGVNGAQRIAQWFGLGAGLRYQIVVHGRPHTRPTEFRWSVKEGPGGGVTVWLWGKPHKFKRSFRLLGSGLRMRLGNPRFPIRSFDGPNLAKEALLDPTAATFRSESLRLVPPAIEKRLMRALG